MSGAKGPSPSEQPEAGQKLYRICSEGTAKAEAASVDNPNEKTKVAVRRDRALLRSIFASCAGRGILLLIFRERYHRGVTRVNCEKPTRNGTRGERLSVRLHVWHATRHVHLSVACRNFEQAGTQRARLNVLQFAAAILALPFHRESDLGIEPNGAEVPTGGLSFVLHCRAAIYSVSANPVAFTAWISGHLLPFAAGIIDIGGTEKGPESLRRGAFTGGEFHVHVLLGHEHVRSLGGEVDQDGSGLPVPAGRLNAQFVLGDVDFGRSLVLLALVVSDDVGGKIFLCEQSCGHHGEE